MASDFPLQTLLDLSQARLDDATRQLGQLLASEQEDEKKLSLLLSYRDEYQARFREAARTGMSRDEWRNFQSFLMRLDEAVARQDAVVNASRQRTAHGQKAWLDERTKVKAYDALSQRHRAREQRIEAKREQRFTDEHAAKQFRAGDEAE
jgi:flagellar FliJ protein